MEGWTDAEKYSTSQRKQAKSVKNQERPPWGRPCPGAEEYQPGLGEMSASLACLGFCADPQGSPPGMDVLSVATDLQILWQHKLWAVVLSTVSFM